MIGQTPKILLFLVFGVLILAGIFALAVKRNTFVVENPNPAPFESVVYLSAANTSNLAFVEQKTLLLEILSTGTGYLNVRADSALTSKKISTVKPGEQYEYTEQKNNWYHIILSKDKTGWVYGQYVQELEE